MAPPCLLHHYEKRVLRPRFKNAAIEPKNGALCSFGPRFKTQPEHPLFCSASSSCSNNNKVKVYASKFVLIVESLNLKTNQPLSQ